MKVWQLVVLLIIAALFAAFAFWQPANSWLAQKAGATDPARSFSAQVWVRWPNSPLMYFINGVFFVLSVGRDKGHCERKWRDEEKAAGRL